MPGPLTVRSQLPFGEPSLREAARAELVPRAVTARPITATAVTRTNRKRRTKRIAVDHMPDPFVEWNLRYQDYAGAPGTTTSAIWRILALGDARHSPEQSEEGPRSRPTRRGRFGRRQTAALPPRHPSRAASCVLCASTS